MWGLTPETPPSQLLQIGLRWAWLRKIHRDYERLTISEAVPTSPGGRCPQVRYHRDRSPESACRVAATTPYSLLYQCYLSGKRNNVRMCQILPVRPGTESVPESR